MIKLAPVLKDRAIFLGWIAGLILASSLLWVLSYPFRATRLMHTTNRVLASMGDDRRLSAALPRQFARAAPLGCWYSLAGTSAAPSLFFVFAILQNGILVPYGAEISVQGEVTSLVPLGNHARKNMDRIPPGLIQVYVRRIESAVAKSREEA